MGGSKRAKHLNTLRLVLTSIMSMEYETPLQALGLPASWKLLCPLLFWPGNTIDILELEIVKSVD
jgi:hypothetical protein